MEKDVMLRSRLTAKQMQALDQIVAELQEQTPEANVSTSSLARYALEKYVSEYIAIRDGTKLFVEIDITELGRDDIANLWSYVKEMSDTITASGNTALKNAIFDLEFKIGSFYFHSIMPKKEG